MLEALSLIVSLGSAASLDRAPALRVDQGSESAAAIATAIRFEPFTGKLTTETRSASGKWNLDPQAMERAEGRTPFSLQFEAATGRLTWGAGAGAPVVDAFLPLPVTIDGANLLRLEVANFDRTGAAKLESLELEIDGVRQGLPWMGHEPMTRDLVTISGTELARGFRLTGELLTRGAASAPSRVFVDLGVGRGRRVEVEIVGPGEVKSDPPRVARAGKRKFAVGYFGLDERPRLEAVGDGFERWQSSALESPERVVEISSDPGNDLWRAQFAPSRVSPELVWSQPDRGSLSASPEGGLLFSNTAKIDVPSGQPGTTSGVASPYPSIITVSGPVAGSIYDVDVSLVDFNHTWPDDVDVLLVSPRGTAAVILSDACGPGNLVDVDWTFSDEAAGSLADGGPCASGTFKPTSYDAGDVFSAPAPAGPYSSTLSAFRYENANGDWSLYVIDDSGSDSGSIDGGWSLTFVTYGAFLTIPGSGSSGMADPYPRDVVVPSNSATVFGTIVDVNVLVNLFYHQFPRDVDLLLVGPTGAKVMLMSDACGASEIASETWTFDDEAASTMSSDSTNCDETTYRPTDYEAGESLPSPAPAGPYGTSLSVFDGTDPVGTWHVYAVDDLAGDVGFIETQVAPQFKTTGIFRHGFESNICGNWQIVPDPCE